jgi:outer membrane putative beta-barrel porin/alpha-amylase
MRMLRYQRVALLALLVSCPLVLLAQDLAPRAYVITPLHSNAVTVTWSYYNGGLEFNGTVPIADAKGTYNVPVFSLYHAFNFFGRSANVTASLPYAVGTFTGEVNSQNRSIYRSGLLDFGARFSVNLYGGHAMPVQEFRKWKQKMLLGASLRVIAPTGQYDPTKLINWGINRWAFKPEFGYSQRWGNWILDGYAGVWFYTTNSAFFNIPVPLPQTEAPVGSLEGHLSYDIPKLKGFRRARLWASLDGNFWWGGVTAVNSIRNLKSEQTSSRIGGTVSFPLTAHQSIKLAYSDGAYIRLGGNYQNVSVAWQYSWLGHPK